MGKKKKGGGAEKTAAKTDKKMAQKLKKNLALAGEDDIEKILAEIEQEEKKKVQVTEKVIATPPTSRAFFSLVAHPEKDELFMFGGEYHNGKETEVFNDLFIYKISKEWRIVKSSGGPGPRSGHASVAVPFNKGEMWVFGGEFTTKSESQFYHYNDLWCLNLDTRQWQKITATGGPCSRSGHRMVAIKKQLIIFGGYHDNLQDYKYFNDVYIFNLEAKSWHKITPSGNSPAARSACQMVATPEGKVLVWGGYSKVKVKKDIDGGFVHSDMFLLSPEKGDETGLKWKWSNIKPGGAKPEPMSGVAVATNPATGRAYTFGGAQDTETEEDINTQFFNHLHSIDLTKYIWSEVSLSGKKEGAKMRRRKKEKMNEEEDADEGEEDNMEVENEPEPNSSQPPEKTVVDDGVFRLQVGGGSSSAGGSHTSGGVSSTLEGPEHPHARINAGLVIKSSKLYLYGGIFETPQVVHTLTDFHILDLQKLDEWKTLVACDLKSQEWLESGSESESGSEGEFDCDSEEQSGSD